MRSIIFLFSFIILVTCISFIPFKQNQLKFPANELNPTSAIDLLNKTDNKIVKVGTSKKYDLFFSLKEYDWYLTLLDKEKSNITFIEEIEEQGWTYITQNGSGLIFKKDNNTVIAKSEIWNENYLVYSFPIN